MQTRSISVLAKSLNINLETIRFYEKKGLISQPIKPESGYRHYPDKTLQRLQFIIRSKQLGFTLEEIRSLLSLNDHPCQSVEKLAQDKLTTTLEKIEDLTKLAESLKMHLNQCKSNNNKASCPVINSLSF